MYSTFYKLLWFFYSSLQYQQTTEYDRLLWASRWYISRPSINHINSLCPIFNTSLSVLGHLNRSFSSRFCHRQKPFRSQYKIFNILLRRLQNTNRCPENGSSSMLLSTRIERPFMALCISVLPIARYTFIPPEGRSIISYTKWISGPKVSPLRIHHQFLFGSCQYLIWWMFDYCILFEIGTSLRI